MVKTGFLMMWLIIMCKNFNLVVFIKFDTGWGKSMSKTAEFFFLTYTYPVLKSLCGPTDTMEDYVSHYSYFGQLLYMYDGDGKRDRCLIITWYLISQHSIFFFSEVCNLSCIEKPVQFHRHIGWLSRVSIRLFWAVTIWQYWKTTGISSP